MLSYVWRPGWASYVLASNPGSSNGWLWLGTRFCPCKMGLIQTGLWWVLSIWQVLLSAQRQQWILPTTQQVWLLSCGSHSWYAEAQRGKIIHPMSHSKWQSWGSSSQSPAHVFHAQCLHTCQSPHCGGELSIWKGIMWVIQHLEYSLQPIDVSCYYNNHC